MSVSARWFSSSAYGGWLAPHHSPYGERCDCICGRGRGGRGSRYKPLNLGPRGGGSIGDANGLIKNFKIYVL